MTNITKEGNEMRPREHANASQKVRAKLRRPGFGDSPKGGGSEGYRRGKRGLSCKRGNGARVFDKTPNRRFRARTESRLGRGGWRGQNKASLHPPCPHLRKVDKGLVVIKGGLREHRVLSMGH